MHLCVHVRCICVFACVCVCVCVCVQARSQTSIKGGSTLGVHAFTQLQSPLIISGGIHNMAHFYMGYHTILKIGTN